MRRIARVDAIPRIKVYTAQNRRAADGETKITGYQSELERATAFFTNVENYHNEQKLTKKDFPFKVYKNKELVQQLEDIFHTKCAYCESDFGAVSPNDIEHYRPKNAIATGTAELKPGYWWIAGEYSNLLISCPDCNRQRTHTVPGQTAGIVLGKGTQFPLSDETVRIRAPAVALAAENAARLLLNPCLDDPEQHLLFDGTGNVTPRLRDGIPSRMGAISIDVYALRRKGLVEARLVALNNIDAEIRHLNKLVLHINELRADHVAQHHIDQAVEMIEECMNKLVKLFVGNAEYLAAKRDWIRNADFEGRFEALRDFGIEPLNLLDLA